MELEIKNKIFLKLYENLMLSRFVNKALAELYGQGKIRSTVFSEIGQEAGGAGICSFLRADDYLLPTYRDYSYVVSKGISLNRLFAEHYGKRTGYCGGRGAGYRFYYPAKGIMGVSVSLGANFSIAIGLGLAIKRKHKKNICICVFGDGAASRGTLHSALNLSALWKLPILWVCENNQYSMSTHVSKIHANSNLADKADAYKICKRIVNGNDAIEIYRSSQEFIQKLRLGEGPCFLELKTYRINSHKLGELDLLRHRREIEKWADSDPLKRLKQVLVLKKILSKQKERQIAEEEKIKINRAVAFSEKSLPVRTKSLLADFLTQ